MAVQTTVTGTFVDASGTPITNATVKFQPVTSAGQSLSFKDGKGSVSGFNQVSALVTNGNFSILLDDTSLTVPENIGYSMTLEDNLTGRPLLGAGFSCLQPTGTAWNLSQHTPTGISTTVVAGPNGLTAYQVAVAAGYSGSESAWLASLVGPPGQVTNAQLGSAVLSIAQVSSTTVNPNMFDASKVLSNTLLVVATGATTGFAGYFTSDFIPVVPGQVYNLATTDVGDTNTEFGLVQYDINKVPIAGSGVSWPFTAGELFTALPTAGFMRFGQNGSQLAVQMFTQGTVAPASYHAFGSYPPNIVDAKDAVIVAQIATTAAMDARTLADATSPLVVNSFDLNRITNPGILRDTGVLDTSFPGFGASDFIPTIPGRQYTIAKGYVSASFVSYCWYDVTRTFLSVAASGTVADNTTVTAPADAYYLRITLTTGAGSGGDFSATQMVTPGATPPSSYVPFAQTAFEQYVLTAPLLEAVLTPTMVATTKGKVVSFIGDSLIQSYGSNWMPAFLVRTGMITGLVDSHSGRMLSGAMESYGGDPIAGVNTLAGTTVNNGTLGNTFGQDLAAFNTDVLFIWLTTNDGATPIGAPGDPTTAATLYGYARKLVEGAQIARPTMRIVFAIAYQNGFGASTPTANEAIATCIKTVCGNNGVPVIDSLHESGINSGNWATFLQSDVLHINLLGGEQLIAPLFAETVKRFL